MLENKNANATSSSTQKNVVKTIYLIRHAESEENRRIGSLKQVGRSLLKFSLPSTNDIGSSLHLMNIPAQVNSNVSAKGRGQIGNVAKQLKEADFWKQIQLLAYSPLERARDTAAGMVRVYVEKEETNDISDNDNNNNNNTMPSSQQILEATTVVPRVVELETLKEKTPAEWLPGNFGSLQQRMDQLQTWLASQPERHICCVGHSQFFKAMLQLDFKFDNCDVWQVELNMSRAARNDKNAAEKESENGNDNNNPYPNLPPQWSGLKRLYGIVPSDNEDNANETVATTANGNKPLKRNSGSKVASLQT